VRRATIRPTRCTAPDGTGALLVGRDSERALIDELLVRAQQGESGSLVLRGEAGIGKSALLGDASRRAEAMITLSVTGVEAESHVDFAGLHSLVRPIIGELDRLPEPQRDAVGAALGLLPADGVDRFLVSAGALSLLAAAAQRRPVLCLIDDAQWLDAPSADALVFSARRLAAEGIVMLFAAREEDVRCFDAAGVEQRWLGGLDAESALTLLAGSASTAVPHVRKRLLDDAGGNPLALLELPSALSEAQLAGREPLPETLPLTDRLRTAFGRLSRVPEETRLALLVMAAEDTGDLRTLRAAAEELGFGPDAIDPAEEIAIVSTHDAMLEFRHPLVRAAVYDAAPRGDRQRVHAALARVLADQQRENRSLWHRTLASETSDEDVAAALEGLAEESRSRGGHASAASTLERAAKLSAAGYGRGRRLAMAAEAAWEAGQLERARDLVRRSEPLADRARLIRLLHLRGRIEGQSGSLDEAVRILQRAIGLSEDASLTLSMLRDAINIAGYAGDYDAAVRLGLGAADVSPASELDRYQVEAIAAHTSSLTGDHARAVAHAAEAVRLAEHLDDPGCLLTAVRIASRHEIGWNAVAILSRVVEVMRERVHVSMLPVALEAQARELINAGRFDLAYGAAEEGWRLALDADQPWPATLNLSCLAVLDAFRGAEEHVADRTQSLEVLVARSGAKAILSNVATARAVLHLGLGRPGLALDHLLPMLAATRPETDPAFAIGVTNAVEAAVRTDRLKEVAEHLERFEAWALAARTDARRALVARCRALIEDADPEQHFCEALTLAPALPAFERARTEQLYGEWLRRQRRRVEARPHLRVALELFAGMSVAPWEARTRRELRASGETARRRDPSTRDDLTAQELQIARLVATGKTNPEVAAQLFLSPRTIDYHLRKVFTKLEITTRTELARMPLDEPLAA
jgi:DNA-binding CsgD family transcriptional regulator